MNEAERLLLAIGGADLELVARSGQRKRKRLLPYGLAAAACLALVLVFTQTHPQWVKTSDAPPSDIQQPSSDISPNLPQQGEESGTLRLLSYTPESCEKAVDFLIYVNEEQFSIEEENGLYCIRSSYPLSEDFPECGMDIFHLSGTTPSQAKLEVETTLKGYELSSEEPFAALPGSLYLRASEGVEWDSKQAEFWFVSDGQGGSFMISARYYLEMEEGMGARFRDMASSFRIVDRSESLPDWMRSLYEAADRLYPALFTADLSGVTDLLAEGADANGYGENVWPEITIVSVDYTLDNDEDPTAAAVSVKHRLNQAEGDSFNYLTMELTRQNGNWYLLWSGIEK